QPLVGVVPPVIQPVASNVPAQSSSVVPPPLLRPAVPPAGQVPNAARITWLILFIALATLGLSLEGMLVAGVDRGNPEERASMFGFGIMTLLLAALCLWRSF